MVSLIRDFVILNAPFLAVTIPPLCSCPTKGWEN